MSRPTIATDDGRLWLPPAGLAGCFIAGMSRQHEGLAPLRDEDCYGHYPASPYCTLTWWIRGEGQWCAVGGEQAAAHGRERLPRITFNGPQRRPVSTWARPPFHGLMLSFRPQTFKLLTQVDANGWLDRWADAHDVLPAAWHPFLQEVLREPGDDARMALVARFIGPLWHSQRATSIGAIDRIMDWCEDMARRAALSGRGRSARQFERRFKQWAGLPHREVYAMGRTERAFFAALQAQARQGAVDWPDVALQAGYSDQSHLIREVRRITGFSPGMLFRQVRTEPAFWMYRLWGLWG